MQGQGQGQVVDTSIVSGRKPPSLALVDSFPCCGVLSRGTTPFTRKFPIVFFFIFLFRFSYSFKDLEFELWISGSIEKDSVFGSLSCVVSEGSCSGLPEFRLFEFSWLGGHGERRWVLEKELQLQAFGLSICYVAFGKTNETPLVDC